MADLTTPQIVLIAAGCLFDGALIVLSICVLHADRRGPAARFTRAADA